MKSQVILLQCSYKYIELRIYIRWFHVEILSYPMFHKLYFTKLSCSMGKNDRILLKIDFGETAKSYILYTQEKFAQKMTREYG